MPADPTPPAFQAGPTTAGRTTLIRSLLQNDTVENIHIVEHDRIRVDYSDGTDAVIGEVRDAEILSMVKAMQSEPNRPLDERGGPRE